MRRRIFSRGKSCRGNDTCLSTRTMRAHEPLEPRLMLAADLVPVSLSISGTPIVGNRVEVLMEWTVRNDGNSVADSASWFDNLYLSADTELDFTDAFTGFAEVQLDEPLLPGETYTVTRSIEVANFAPGEQYVLLAVDEGDQQPEGDTSNNLLATPISLVAPDTNLFVSTIRTSPATVLGQPLTVSLVLFNFGNDPARATRYDHYYLSSDTTIDEDDVFLWEQEVFEPHIPSFGASEQRVVLNLPLDQPLGEYFLIAQPDSFDDQFGPTEIALTSLSVADAGPDFVVTEASANPTSVLPGGEIEVRWNVQNVGTQAYAGEFTSFVEDGFYASDDPFLDDADTLLFWSATNVSPGLDPGEHYESTTTFAVNAAPISTQYLLIVADRDHLVGEEDEGNNVLAIPFTVEVPNVDLVAQNFAPPTHASSGQQLQLSWRTANSGTQAATYPRTSRVYLSQDQLLDAGDLVLAEDDSTLVLQPDDSEFGFAVATLPHVEGQYYWILDVNADGAQPDLEPANDLIVSPLLVTTPPDLAITEVDAPSSHILGAPLTATYTVTNLGAGPAVPSFSNQVLAYDAVYLSVDDVWDSFDQLVDDRFDVYAEAIGPGEGFSRTYNVSTTFWNPNANYLIFVADNDAYQADVNRANNYFVHPIELQAPDLAVLEATGPELAAVGQSYEISWTVQNQGVAPAVADWIDRIILSTSPTGSPVTAFLSSYDASSVSPLAPDATYTEIRDITIPAFVTPGSYYLVFDTDQNQNQPESNEGNNRLALPIEIVPPLANLEIVEADLPPSLVLGVSTAVTWTVANTGSAPANNAWFDSVFLSSDDQLGNDLFLGNGDPQHPEPLAVDGQYTKSLNVNLGPRPLGTYYLIFVADAANTLPEISEADNVLVIPVEVAGVDLIVEEVMAPPALAIGEFFEVTYIVRNIGTVPTHANWTDALSLVGATSYTLGSRAVVNSPPLGPGETRQITFSGTVPLEVEPGTYDLLVNANSTGTMIEPDLTNNGGSASVEVSAAPLPDLVIESVSVPLQGVAGDAVQVAWTVTNNGGQVASGTWADLIRFHDSSGTPQGGGLSLPFTGTLAPGEAITRVQTLALPSVPGEYRLVVTADHLQQLAEGFAGEQNNLAQSELSNVLPAPTPPDLVVTSIVPPGDGVLSGTTVEVSFTVTNQGELPTHSPIWTDYVFLTSDPDVIFRPELNRLDNITLYELTASENPTYLNPGESYAQTVEIELPIDAVGPYFVYVFPNGLGVHFHPPMAEADVTNNLTRSEAFSVSLAPPADLQITQVQAPALALSGQPITVNWQVTNLGGNRTAAQAWSDAVYLSSDPLLDEEDILLGFVERSGAIDVDESYAASLTALLPDGISGAYHVLVQADVFEDVFEQVFDLNNVAAASPTNVLLTPPPDLETEILVAPASIVGGQPLPLTYRVSNNGSTATHNVSWTDRFYLSSDAHLDEDDLLLSELPGFAGQLSPGESYTRNRTLVAPNGVEGDYYLIVQADDGGVVFEVDRDNNIARSALQVDSRPADLVVTSFVARTSGTAGGSIVLAWSVTNVGQGVSDGSAWYDKIYLEPAGGGPPVLLGKVQRNEPLSVGASYQASGVVALPALLDGNYELYVVADAPVFPQEDGPTFSDNRPRGAVYEGAFESNNASTRASLSVGPLTADLVVTDIQITPPAVTGQPLTVSWTVQNQGAHGTNTDHWYDDVFLSADEVYDASDFYLGGRLRGGYLAAGASYTATRQVMLPDELAAGNYHIVVRADRPVGTQILGPFFNRVFELDAEDNNDRSSAPLIVELSPVADLVVTSVVAPLQVTSGNQLALTWTVENQGAAPASLTWRDSVYLSIDQVLDPSTDRFLGYFEHAGVLGVGASYTRQQNFNVPLGFAGSFYVYVLTDSSNWVFERVGELNNAARADSVLQVDLPTPLDLVVGTIDVPAAGIAGQQLSITFSVNNHTSGSSIGAWQDSLYLSLDEQWDLGDVLLGRVLHEGGIGAHAAYTETLETALPPLAPGSYRVIVRTDIRNQVAEIDDANNLSASLEEIDVDAPQLQLGVPLLGTLGEGQTLLFKIVVSAGETLQIDFDSESSAASNEIFLSYEAVPTPSRHDYRFNTPFSADQHIRVPTTREGTYYLRVDGRSVPDAPADFSLTARLIPFAVESVDLASVGNAGPSTLEIRGGRFDRATNFRLVGPDNDVQEATSIVVTDGSTAYATFDLSGRPLGSYRIEASNGAETVGLDNAVQVVVGQGPRVLAGVFGPTALLVGRKTALTLTYTNEGDADAIVPLITLTTPNNTRFGLTIDGTIPYYVQLAGSSPIGPGGVLRPGQTVSVPVFVHAPLEVGAQLLIDVSVQTGVETTFLDWNEIEARSKPLDMSATEWTAVRDQLELQMGTTVGDYVRMLARNASLLPAERAGFPTVPGSPADPLALLALEIDFARAALNTSLQGRVEIASLDVEISNRTLHARNVSTGELFVTNTLRDGSFVFPSVTPGSYQFGVDGAAIVNPPEVVVANGQALTGIHLQLDRGRRISGTVSWSESGLPVAHASILAELQSDDFTILRDFAVSTDANGRYVLAGLPEGTYTLFVSAPGVARFSLPDVTIDTSDVVRDVLVQPAARIKGNFTLAPGGPGMSLASVVAYPNGDPEAAPLSSSQSASQSYTLDSLPPGTYDVAISVPGYVTERIAGVVVGPGQTVTADAVQLELAASVAGIVTSSDPFTPAAFAPLALYRNGVEVAAFQADELGGFALDGLEPGQYEVRPAAADRYVTSAHFQVAAGDQVVGLEVAIHVGATIAGVLTDADTGDPLVGYTLHVVDPEGQQLAVRTNAQGAFQFLRLGRGEHRILLPLLEAAAEVPLDLVDLDGDVHQINLKAQVVARLHGQLKTADDQPIARGTVELLDGDVILATAVTDANGRYEFLLLSIGTFDLRASAPTASFAGVAGVVVALDDAIEQDLVAGSATLEVTIQDGTQAAAGVAVYLTRLDGDHVLRVGEAETNEFGVATFQNLEPGDYGLRAIGANTLGIRTNLSVEAGSNQEVLALAQEFRLTGTISGPAGPVAAATVSVVDAQGNVVAFGFSQLDGTYAVRNIPGGVYDVVVFAPGHRAVVETTLALGGNDVVDFVLSASQSQLVGRAVDDLGRPLVAGSATVLDAAGHLVGTAPLQADGTFVVDSAVGPDLTLLIHAPGYRPLEMSGVVVPETGTQDAGDIVLVAAHLGSVASDPLIEEQRVQPQASSPAVVASPSLANASFVSGLYGASAAASLASASSNVVPRTATEPLADCGCGSKISATSLAPRSVTASPTLSGLGVPSLGTSGDDLSAFLLGGALSGVFQAASGGNAWLRSLLELEDVLTSLGTGIDESLVLPLPECSNCGGARQKVLNAIQQRDAAYRDAIRQAAVVALRATSALTTLVRQTAELAIKTAGLYSSVGAVSAQPLAQALGLTGLLNGIQSTVLNQLSQGKSQFQAAVGCEGANAANQQIIAGISNATGLSTSIGSYAVDLAEKYHGMTAGQAGGALGFMASLNVLTFTLDALSGTNFAETVARFCDADRERERFEIIKDRWELLRLEAEKADLEYAECLVRDEERRAKQCEDDDDDDDSKPHPRPNVPSDHQYRGGTLGAHDPNDIAGPFGYGDERFVPADQRLHYTVFFENIPEATAPAQQVVITLALDDNVDFRSFRLSAFGWGDLRFDLPTLQPFINQRVDLTQDLGIFVDVIATVDVQSGLASWTLSAIDPATGESPSSVLVGFLPPNTEDGVGEGFVDFSVLPKSSVVTGDVIRAQARIVFDINEPIDTPEIFNTIDAAAPTSEVAPLPATVETDGVTVQWSGADDEDGSALAGYTIYVSQNGGPFEVWLENTILTSATYLGTPGNTYAFYSVAQDNAGNVEAAPSTGDAAVTLEAPAPVLDPVGDREVDEGTLLSFVVTATHSSVLPVTLIFTLDSGAPAGASIHPTTGVFTWTPGEEQGPGEYEITMRVTDNGTPALDDFETITVMVAEVNQAPVLQAIGDRQVDEGTLLTFTAVAIDGDLPANALSYSLDSGAPAGASIHPTTGVFTWTPGEEQGPGEYEIAIRVTDNGTPALDDFETITVMVSGEVATPNLPSTIGLYEPTSSSFFLRHANVPGPADQTFNFGPPNSSWVPLAGDFNGDGQTTIGFYSPGTGTFLLKSTLGPGPADLVFNFGAAAPGVVPLVGDWDGDGTDTVGIYAAGTFFLSNDNAAGPADLMFAYGPNNPSWTPVVGDWTGDGQTNVGFYEPTNSAFFLKNSQGAGAADIVFGFGPGGSFWTPLVGDWNADGTETVGLYSGDVFYLRNTFQPGPADESISFGPPGNNWSPLVGQWLPSGAPLHVTTSPAGDLKALPLSTEALAPFVDLAIAQWANVGLPALGVARLRATEVAVADLPGNELGRATSSRILVDIDAAGYGWNFGHTRDNLDSLQVDLLSVLAHEFGHVLGLDDLDLDFDDPRLMNAHLQPGIRREPGPKEIDDLLTDHDWIPFDRHW